MRRTAVVISLVAATLGLAAGPALATPVCTDGYMGGPPLAACGNRIFPEAANSQAYIQFSEYPVTGFREYQHGIEFLAQKYPRWVSVFSLSSKYGDLAKSVGADGIRPDEQGDTGDGRDIWIVKLTDHEKPDAGKETLFFSLSVHGNERGGLEGGMRAVEDLAMAAEGGGTIVDGVDNYTSGTGKTPEFHEYEVADVLAKEAVYFASFNPDGWAVGDIVSAPATSIFGRENGAGTDLNRQMPTKGSINLSRDPLTEPEAKYGVQEMHAVAAQGIGKLLAYGADVHGELTSRAYVDIMYPAGQFDSVKHRQLMAIAERTKSVIDETLYAGIQNEIEEATGGNDSEGLEEQVDGLPSNTIPTMPAHWATVWDTLGYTDTGFIGDYLATDLAVTGMDYEIMLNHTVPDKTWNVYLQENHINASRAIIKTAMAYALTQSQEFNDKNVVLDTGGQAGYVVDPVRVTDKDKDGPGAGFSAESANGSKVVQAPYSVSNQDWFRDTSRLMPKPFVGLASADIANDPTTLDQLDTLVLADLAMPGDPNGRPVDRAKYFANIKSWVERGGNLVLTDRAVHVAGEIGVLPADAIVDETVYQPNATSINFEHALTAGLRGNAKQLVEAAILGYGIGNDASPMTVVDTAALTEAGGTALGHIEKGSGEVTSVASLGELSLGKGLIRLIGGALPTPTEDNDHRYGLRSYGLTYSGLFIMENAIRYDAAGLGAKAPRGFTPVRPAPPVKPAPADPLPATGAGWEMALVGGAFLVAAARLRRRRAHGRAA